MPATLIDPDKPEPQPPPAQTGSGQGTVPAPAPPPAQTGGGATLIDQPKTGDGQQAPSQPWTINPQTWPQSEKDWLTLYGNEWGMGTLPYLKTMADAARTRLGPVAAGSADFAGAATSPSQFITPWLGPEASGAFHEGLKSYNNQPNWIPTLPAAEKIGADTALGAVTMGLPARLGAMAAPNAARAAVSAGIPTGTASLGHLLFGHWDPYREAANVGSTALATLGVQDWLNEAGKGARDWVANSPATKQAVKSLILGAGSAARNMGGPSMYDQWIPGQ